MTSTAAARRPTLTPAEIYSLPAMCPAQTTICDVTGIGASMYFELLAAGDLPIPTTKLGRLRFVKRADILRFCGLPENDDRAEVAPSALPVERDNEPTGK
ncbi:hypothetical protein [Streptomyces sp. H39-C1]|uniref:hypothetical protein n=1 Tax=Streptomyces sp. H39-C1 TaxID=3004355 RepID=UPI0022AF35DD|nr:hypothetical protein [Streptomyces sp. H39-C1]MCZ4099873.1 hypothetical protein [Streptomyces sp. H39-C1]